MSRVNDATFKLSVLPSDEVTCVVTHSTGQVVNCDDLAMRTMLGGEAIDAIVASLTEVHRNVEGVVRDSLMQMLRSLEVD